jgi:hypothetical protein
MRKKDTIFRDIVFNLKDFKLINKIIHIKYLYTFHLTTDELNTAKDLALEKVIIIDDRTNLIMLNMHSKVTKELIHILKWFLQENKTVKK